MNRFDRRTFLAGAGAIALGTPAAALAQAQPRLVMWKDPSCGCCTHWAERVQAAFGEPVRIVPVADMAALKRARGIPQDLWSCHTASIHGLIVEGHVPPADIRRLLATRSRAFSGLAVPGMPAGAPGMDIGHTRRDPYQVIAFGPAGRRAVYARHG
ncbi:MAG TPA: DUF411 domain-containing protein [Allosphingosinicella sp.]|nr:DUF411 domain-containing protein [Allosphingosinicella sp.]